ncbi:MAG: 6-phosphogluconolactonase [Halarcobacter sp.]
MSSILKKFDTPSSLVDNLASQIIKDLEDAILKKGEATLLVSGGNTPKPLFEKLSNIDFQWEKITIALVDERWIDTTNCNSNENLVKNFLLKNYASKAKFIGMYILAKEITECEEYCSKAYQKLFPFDVIILGMGNDAHTASLFPNNKRLKEGFDLDSSALCLSIEPETAPYTRMSLNLKAILSADKIYLHIEGQEKFDVYKKALESKDIYTTPISSVLNSEHKNIEVFYS